MSARAAALQALQATLVGGRFLDEVLDGALAHLTDARDRALARDLAYGVCRYWHRLSAVRDSLLERPLKAKDQDVGIVLVLGLYQLTYSRVAAHAAVAETVALCEALRKRWASGLVNAVLRRFQRERDACLLAADADTAVRLSYPDWLLDALRNAWPDRWQDIAAAGNVQAPMTLRVNRRRLSREDSLKALRAAGFEGEPTAFSTDGIVLASARDVSALPGFAAGDLSVQDEAAQLAAGLLAARDGERFLDACAAPGGKLAHVLETTPGLASVLAVEHGARRAQRTRDTLQRLGLHAALAVADARSPESWWDGKPFDCILVDAPCSATGVIRRHPDIKLNRRPGDLLQLANRQYQLLSALWPLLARGGRLLYATCSVLPEENAAVVTRFARALSDVVVEDLDVPWGEPASPGRQIFPGEAGMDGFYYALLVKR